VIALSRDFLMQFRGAALIPENPEVDRNNNIFGTRKSRYWTTSVCQLTIADSAAAAATTVCHQQQKNEIENVHDIPPECRICCRW